MGTNKVATGQGTTSAGSSFRPAAFRQLARTTLHVVVQIHQVNQQKRGLRNKTASRTRRERVLGSRTCAALKYNPYPAISTKSCWAETVTSSAHTSKVSTTQDSEPVLLEGFAHDYGSLACKPARNTCKGTKL